MLHINFSTEGFTELYCVKLPLCQKFQLWFLQNSILSPSSGKIIKSHTSAIETHFFTVGQSSLLCFYQSCVGILFSKKELFNRLVSKHKIEISEKDCFKVIMNSPTLICTTVFPSAIPLSHSDYSLPFHDSNIVKKKKD